MAVRTFHYYAPAANPEAESSALVEQRLALKATQESTGTTPAAALEQSTVAPRQDLVSDDFLLAFATQDSVVRPEEPIAGYSAQDRDSGGVESKWGTPSVDYDLPFSGWGFFDDGVPGARRKIAIDNQDDSGGHFGSDAAVSSFFDWML
jgi:hypothetical protein